MNKAAFASLILAGCGVSVYAGFGRKVRTFTGECPGEIFGLGACFLGRKAQRKD
ncbi:MAG TPA: hypothetical protein VLX68_13330 [Chitinivibrionales bacterium]|nr:hypothetical protein [Chitinivibrionales bacterium]